MKTKKNIILCICLTVVFAALSCKTADVNQTSNGSSASSVEIAPGGEPKTALFSAFKNMGNAPSWIADIDMKVDSAPQFASKIQLKFSKPNSVQMDGTLAGNEMKFISVDGKNYVQINGKWRLLPASADSEQMTKSFQEMSDIKNQEAFKNVQFVGKEAVDGKELAVYTYDFDQKLANAKESSGAGNDESKSPLADTGNMLPVKVWVDEKKNLPVKINMTMKSPQPDKPSNNLELKYDFDQEFKIEAPTL